MGLDDFARAIEVADLNGDSLPDILARETTFGDGQLSVFLNNPLNPGFFTRTIFVLPGSDDAASDAFQQIRTADFNSDGNLDVVVKDVLADNVRILFGDGTGDFPSSVVLSTGSPDLIEIDVADFNGDGNPDLVCDYRNLTGIPVGVAVMFGDGQGGFSPPVITPIVGASGSMFAVRAGDFDGDGTPDVVTGIFGDNVFAVLPNVVSGVPDVFASPAGDFSTLVENPDETFTRTLKNGTRIEFDADGLMTAAVDRNGNTTAYAYDGGGNLTTITDPAGLVTTLAYTGGLLTSVTDPASRITGFAHDGGGNLTQITDPDSSARLFAYDGRHRLTSQTSKRGFVTSYDYGFHGRNVRADRPDGSFTLTAASEVVGLIDVSAGEGTPANPAPFTRPDDVVASFTDGNGNATVFELDKFGGATGRTDALGRTTETVRDANSLVTQTTAANGRVTEMTYDGLGNLLTLTEAVGDALERVTTIEYEAVFNQVTKITDPRGNETTFAYDGNGNLTTVTDAALTSTVMAYGDANCPGLVTSVTRAAALAEETTTTFAYDPVTCNLAATTDDLGNPTTFAYDGAGNAVSVTDALLRESRFEYDGLNRVTKSIDATNSDVAPACGLAGVTCFAFDGAGNLTDLTDANGNVTSFDYDARERVTDRSDPLVNAEIFTYDGQGNLRFATDREGQVIEFQYDLADRLVKKIMQPGQPEEAVRDIGYDLVNNVTSVVDPDSSLTFGYDLLNRVETADTTGSPVQPAVTLTASYDANGNRLTLDDPVGQSAYVYDVLNRLTDLTTPSLPVQPVLYSFDALSRRTGVSLPNGVETSLTFDTASRLTDISHIEGGVTTVSDFGYGHDTVNQRTSLTQTRPSVTVQTALAYVYDDLDRLTQATNPQIAAADETFGYDPLGNRLNRDGQVVDSTFDAANRLIEDPDFTYAYDLNGNLVTKTAKIGGAVTDYTWDAEDRLTRIDLPGGGFADYVYDGIGRRIQKDVNGTVTRYVYDGADILLEYDGTNFLLARYTHGPGIDDPVMVERDIDTSGTFDASERFFYQTDGLGSVTELTDSTGSVARAVVYDSYGQIAQDTGGVEQPFSYTGRELDLESGLYFYRARFYDAAAGRFLSEDPIGFGAGDTNLYRYVFNNPIRLTDPSGQICLSPIEIAAASGAFGGALAGAVLGAPGGPLTAALGAFAGGLGGAAVGSLGAGIAGGALGGAVGGAAGGGVSGALGGVVGGAVDSAVSEGSGGGFVGGFLGGFAGGAVGGAVGGGVTGGLAGAQVAGTIGAVAGAAAGASAAFASEILNAINDCPCE